MSACIISLPGSVSSPVQQSRRRGRFPKRVVSLQRVRRERAHAQLMAIERGRSVQIAREQAARLYAQAERYRGLADGLEAGFRASGMRVIFEEGT